MKKYEYYQSSIVTSIALAISTLAQAITIYDGGFSLIFLIAQIYFAYFIATNKMQYIALSENSLNVPSFCFKGLFTRNISWGNIKKISIGHLSGSGAGHGNPVIYIKLKKGVTCMIFASAVNIYGARSRGLEPYQQLIEDINRKL